MTTVNEYLSSIENDYNLNNDIDGSFLRKCQYSAYFEVKSRIESFLRRGVVLDDRGSYIVQMATGTGKSGVIGLLSTCLPGSNLQRVLVVTPSDSVRTQLSKVLNVSKGSSNSFWSKINHWPEAPITIKKCDSKDNMPTPKKGTGRHITVTTVQSILSFDKNNPGQLQKYYDLVLFDEGHKKVAEEWDEVIEKINVPSVLFTATPYRPDGKSLKANVVYKYTFEDAHLESDKILKTVRIHQEDAESNFNGFISTICQKLNEIESNWNTNNFKPKAIIRAKNSVEIKRIVQAFNKQGKKAIGIHSKFQISNSKTYIDTRNKIPKNVRVLVHQHILLEGYDDPSVSVVGFADTVEDGRVFIQQLGRALRAHQEVGANQQAHIYYPNRGKAEKLWQSYLKFEKDPHLFEYMGQDFIPHLEYDTSKITNNLVIRPSIEIRQIDDFDFELIQTFFKSSLAWLERRSDVGNVIPFVNNEDEDIPNFGFIYQRTSPPVFIKNSFFENIKLELFLVCFFEGFIFIQSSLGRRPECLKVYNKLTADDLSKLLPANDVNVKSMKLRNIFSSKGLITARSFWAHKAEDHIFSSRDGTYAPSQVTWNSDIYNFSESITLGSSKYHASNVIDFDGFKDLCKSIAEELTNRTTKNELFEKVATPASIDPGEPFLARVDLPDGARLRNRSGNYINLESNTLYIELDENCEGKLQCLDSNTSVSNKIRFTYCENSKKYEAIFVSSRSSLTLEYIGENYELLDYLFANNLISIMTNNGCSFINGAFYVQKQPDVKALSSHLISTNIYSSCKSERTERHPTRPSDRWPVNCVFGAFEQRHVGNAELFGDFNYLFCDDRSGEIADYIAYDTVNKKIILIHCKYNRGLGVRIKNYYEVLGQAIKNLDYAWKKLSISKFNWWKNPSHRRFGRNRLRVGTLTPTVIEEIQALYDDPLTTREVWVIQPHLDVNSFLTSLNDFTNAPENKKKLAYLIDQTCISLNSRGIKFRFFGT